MPEAGGGQRVGVTGDLRGEAASRLDPHQRLSHSTPHPFASTSRRQPAPLPSRNLPSNPLRLPGLVPPSRASPGDLSGRSGATPEADHRALRDRNPIGLGRCTLLPTDSACPYLRGHLLVTNERTWRLTARVSPCGLPETSLLCPLPHSRRKAGQKAHEGLIGRSEADGPGWGAGSWRRRSVRVARWLAPGRVTEAVVGRQPHGENAPPQRVQLPYCTGGASRPRSDDTNCFAPRPGSGSV